MGTRARWAGWLLVLGAMAWGLAPAQSTFDLAGPPLDVHVMREDRTLPISQVPNLQAGDRLWIHPDFPEQQAARYLLVVAFLRGSTNPPPEDWFTRAETWNKKVREEGIFVNVPPEAQQALIFLAPETGGDFTTLKSNVKSKPGSFVRASQDLVQASLDRSRLDAYVAGVNDVSQNDPAALPEKSRLLARSLNVKLDSECFKRPQNQWLTCLTDDRNGLVLDDGHTLSMVAALTSGAASDLIGQLSATSLAGGGQYSPYVGAIVDVVRIMDGIHTARFQYIPALGVARKDTLDLKLNNPPSFANPKSVLTVGLPAVESAQLPPLRAVEPKQVYCAEAPNLVLPVDGAPLIYSTSLGHDFTLHVQDRKGQWIDLPARPDAQKGGFAVDTHAAPAGTLEAEPRAVLRGYWGFQVFNGPSFHVQSAHPARWKLPGDDETALIVGRDDIVHLQAPTAECAAEVSVKDEQGHTVRASYKVTRPDELEVKVPLQDASPGKVTLLVKQWGMAAADELPMRTYSEAGHLDHMTLYAGDQRGELEGTRLDEVATVELGGVAFTPGTLTRADQRDRLTLATAAPVTALQPDQTITAQVTLKDGRVRSLATTILPPRPRANLLSKSVPMGAAGTGLPSSAAAPTPASLSGGVAPVSLTGAGTASAAPAVQLGNADEIPQDAKLTFVLQTQIPATWSRHEKVEVAAADGSFSTMLNIDDGSLTLQDVTTVLAVLEPRKSFGASAFGPLRFRVIDGNGERGDWQPLGTLVRLPTLTDLHCPSSPDKQCTLTGANLFLLDSLASDAEFKISVPVPLGYANPSLSVPRVNDGLLYFKLRDDPAAVNTVTLPVIADKQ